MTTTLKILLYYLAPQRFMAVGAGIGLILIVLAMPASLVSGNLAMGLSIYGFAGALAIPFLSSGASSRDSCSATC